MTDQEKKEETVVICMKLTTPMLIADNRVGRCFECGCKVQFRPHAPKGKRLCLECVEPFLADANITTTPQMIADAKAYFRRKMQ